MLWDLEVEVGSTYQFTTEAVKVVQDQSSFYNVIMGSIEIDMHLLPFSKVVPYCFPHFK